jgi:hypothetical protein
MTALFARDLLATWERAQQQPWPARALALLAPFCPDASADALAQLSIGERDARLLRARIALFGSRIAARADCPACHEPIEIDADIADLDIADLDIADLDIADLDRPAPSITASRLEDGPFVVEYRLPTTADLVGLTTSGVQSARQMLLERCVSAASRDGEPIRAGDLPDGVATAVANAMERADPRGHVQFELACPSCGERWDEIFDIASFFWTEVHAWAMRQLREVHALASAYGWSEADILALGPARRRAYLEMLGS